MYKNGYRNDNYIVIKYIKMAIKMANGHEIHPNFQSNGPPIYIKIDFFACMTLVLAACLTEDSWVTGHLENTFPTLRRGA
jgi:hypothetical protein